MTLVIFKWEQVEIDPHLWRVCRLEVGLELDGVHEDGLAGGADEALLSAPSMIQFFYQICSQQDDNDIVTSNCFLGKISGNLQIKSSNRLDWTHDYMANKEVNWR